VSNQRRARKKKPTFRRQDSYKYVRVKGSWRRPKGKSSKMRLGMKGWPISVGVGFKSAKTLRGLHPSGFKEILVYRPEDLDSIDPSRQVARIGHTVGAKKRTVIIEKANEHNIRILNPQGVVLVESEEPEETSI